MSRCRFSSAKSTIKRSNTLFMGFQQIYRVERDSCLLKYCDDDGQVGSVHMIVMGFVAARATRL